MGSLRVILLVLLTIIAEPVQADSPVPFTSDGCSAFPNGTYRQPDLWLHCCILHDFDYWKGGSFRSRIDSDNRLEQCVNKTGQDEVALLMLAGVRLGGSPYIPSPFRWGYGWPYPKLYGPLDPCEKGQLSKLTVKLSQDHRALLNNEITQLAADALDCANE